MTPLFSIIVPVYKVAPYLRECLDSVLRQTYPNWECICVDDGSPDESGTILDEYARQDARIKVLHRQNGGVSAARNAGMDIATGDYLLFLDGDDAYVPWCLERLSEILSKNGQYDILRYKGLSEINFFDPPARCDREVLAYGTNTRADRGLALLANVPALIAWNACYRRDAVGNVRFRVLSHNEDTLFGAEVVFRAQCIAHVDEILYRYRVSREGSATSKESLGKVKSVLAALQFLVASFVESKFVDCSREFSRIVMGILRIVFVQNCELGAEKGVAQNACVECAVGLIGTSKGRFSSGLRQSLTRLAERPSVETYAYWIVEPLDRMERVCRIKGMGRMLHLFRTLGFGKVMESLRCYDS